MSRNCSKTVDFKTAFLKMTATKLTICLKMTPGIKHHKLHQPPPPSQRMQ